MNGKQVFENAGFKNGELVDCHNFPEGEYYVRISGHDETFTKKTN